MIRWVPDKHINQESVMKYLQQSIDSRNFTNYGPNVRLLESTLHSLLKIDEDKVVIACANGTVALWAVVAMFEVYHNKDLQFVTQAFTFPASAQGYLQTVKIADIDDGGGLDISSLDPAACDGIIVTNVFGNTVDISKYEEWCKKHSKLLIFDNAATSYTFYNGKNVSNYGDASIVSLHHTKPIGFGEGGCIVIPKQYESTLRPLLNFGIDNAATNPKWHPKGGNYKMSDIQAAYILQYLEQFNDIVKKTQELYTYFLEESKDIKEFKLYPTSVSPEQIPFLSCLAVLCDKSTELIDAFLKADIYCRKYYKPLEDLPKSVELYNRIVCISFTKDMTRDDVKRIVSILKSVLS